MAAKIIAIVNEKGGAGKTTSSMQLAAGLALEGLRVLVVDSDPQQTAMAWAAAAPIDSPFPAIVISLAAAGSRLSVSVRDHRGNYDAIVIDGPPSKDSPLTAAAVTVADLVIVPAQLSPPDLWATARTASVIRAEQEKSSDGGPAAFLLATSVQSTKIADDVKGALEQLGLPRLQAQLGYRAAYRESIALGTSIHKLNKKGAEEVTALTREVMALLSLQSK